MIISFFLCSYVNQMVVEYNVQCQAGQLAFIQFDRLDLEPKNCYDGTTMRCIKTIPLFMGANYHLMYADVKIMLRLMLAQEDVGSSVEIAFPTILFLLEQVCKCF